MITPDDARRARDSQNKLATAPFETRIDAYLSSRDANAFGEWWFGVAGVSDAIVTALCALYSPHWDVRVVRGQHDDALVFKHRAVSR